MKMVQDFFGKNKIFSALLGSAFFALALVFFLIGSLPFFQSKGNPTSATSTLLNFDLNFSDTSTFPVVATATTSSDYRIIIPKIGVDMPVIIDEPNPDKGLLKGAWFVPGTAIPGTENSYNNTVISAHRYRYTSGPHTFFSLDKLEAGDEILIIWKGQPYKYKVNGSKVVPPTAVQILDKTPTKTLTLFTCTPLYTTLKRLVVTATLQN